MGSGYGKLGALREGSEESAEAIRSSAPSRAPDFICRKIMRATDALIVGAGSTQAQNCAKE